MFNFYVCICQEAKAREQVTVGSAEKQKIIMQISAVQTDIKRNLEERLLQDRLTFRFYCCF